MTRVAGGDREAMRRVAKASAPLNAMMRTTCVATQLEGGHATNALPQLAAANINCRLLPDDSADRVVAELTKLVADDQVKITIATNEGGSPASPLRPDIMQAFNPLLPALLPQEIDEAGSVDVQPVRHVLDSPVDGRGLPLKRSGNHFRIEVIYARRNALGPIAWIE